MTEQIPVLDGTARGLGVFDHRVAEVPAYTFHQPVVLDQRRRASGNVVNVPDLGTRRLPTRLSRGRLATESNCPALTGDRRSLRGEAFLTRIYNPYQTMQAPTGANVWNRAVFIA